jgi:hypothetical protein
MLVCYAVPPQSLVHGGGEKTSRALALLPAPTENRRLFPGSLEQSEQFTSPESFRGTPALRFAKRRKGSSAAASPFLHHFCTISGADRRQRPFL